MWREWNRRGVPGFQRWRSDVDDGGLQEVEEIGWAIGVDEEGRVWGVSGKGGAYLVSSDGGVTWTTVD